MVLSSRLFVRCFCRGAALRGKEIKGKGTGSAGAQGQDKKIETKDTQAIRSKVTNEQFKKKYDEVKAKIERTSGSGGNKSKGNFAGKMLILIGLPVVAVLLFYFLPTQTPADIHSIDWYNKHPDYWKDRDEKHRKESSLDYSDKGLYPGEPEDKGHIDMGLKR